MFCVVLSKRPKDYWIKYTNIKFKKKSKMLAKDYGN